MSTANRSETHLKGAKGNAGTEVAAALARISDELERGEIDYEQEKAIEEGKRLKEQGNLVPFIIAFANPYDKVKAQRVIKEQGCNGKLKVTDRIPRGEPYFHRLNLNVDVVDRMKRKDEAYAKRLQEKYFKEAWEAYVYEVERRRPRQKGEIRLPYPHPKQKTIIYEDVRYKVMVCGRRFGKTTSALIAAVLQAIEKPRSIIFYIAPTYRQAKSIAWSTLLGWLGDSFKRKNEQELLVEFHNGSKIVLKGADNPDSLRGTYVHLAIMDEYADMKPSIWDEIIRPQLADTKGRAWFMGTPRGYDHFHDLWKRAFTGELGGDWQAYRLTTYDNPHIERAEIEAAKAQSDERAFSQEYLAEFVQFEGLVYKDFNKAAHVRDFDLTKVVGVDLCGLDWGADHPTAGIFLRITPTGQVYVWGEHYEREKAVEEHAKALKKLAKRGKVRQWFLDPSAKQVSEDLKKQGIKTKKAVNDRIYGISELRTLLKGNKLIIHPTCVNLVYEFEHHRYKDRKGAKKNDVDRAVLKEDDDALDALRYAVASHFRGQKQSFEGKSYHGLGQQAPGIRRSFDRVNLDNNRNLYAPVEEDAMIAPEFKDFYN